MITFVIPSLGRPTIERSVESLINQTNKNWKAIIVYDGVDGKNFDDTRITTIKTDKLGLVGPKNGQSGLVRNIGIEKVNTDWIGFLDDDDSIEPTYVDTLLKKYTDYDFVVWRMKYESGLVLPPFHINDLIFATVGISFCYNKNKFSDLFFTQNRDGEDFDFLMKLKNRSKNFTITPEIMYNVRH